MKVMDHRVSKRAEFYLSREEGSKKQLLYMWEESQKD
jgi:hypothetical protein